MSSAKRRPSDRARREPCKAEIATLTRLFQQELVGEAAILATSLTNRFPKHGFGWKVLGAALQAQGRNEDSLHATRQAIALLPNDAATYNNLATALLSLGRNHDAEAHIRKALAIAPGYAKALRNLGILLRLQGKLSESEACCRHALRSEPRYANAHVSLGNALEMQNKLSEAQDSYRAALAIRPDMASIHTDLLHLLSLDVQVEPQQLFAEHVAFGEQYEAPLRAGWQTHSNVKDPARCLQVGFVSGDLYDHAVASFLEPVLEFLIKKEKLSLHAYYTNTINDTVTQRLRTYFSHWHTVVDTNDVDLANKIRADGIDILIDLSGHTTHNRLLTFARKPAPIQVSWMGYPGTTGLQAMDYYICDKFFVPPGELDWQFTEKMVYLPTSSVFQPDASAPEVNRLPALDNGYITFGSFNRDNKINDAVIMLFALVLQRTPNAHLIMAGINHNNQPDFAERFAMAGINADRLTFYPRANMHDYLKLHHLVDVCLDTFPYGGGTTTFHAAYMGVPTVTLAGETAASRSGASILGRLGLVDFVATSIDNFVEISAASPAKVNELAFARKSMRTRFHASGLGKPELLSEHIEAALRTAWERWCVGTPAETLTIAL